MGNRAVITTAPFSKSNVGVYLHWNGGIESINGFLAACKELGLRPPAADTAYAMANFTHIVALFFGTSGLSLGVAKCGELDCDNGDNGVYLIGGNWEIVGRKYSNGKDSPSDEISNEICRSIVDDVNELKRIRKGDSKQ